MDNENLEGIFGTSDGSIYYLSYQDPENPMQVRLISRVCKNHEKIGVLMYDFFNPNVFLSSCGTSNGDVKLFTSQYVDQIITIDAKCGPVKFII